MLNNQKLIGEYLKFPDEHKFYFIQILQRKKDNPEQEKSVRCLGNYYVYSKEGLEHMMPEIISLCELNKARAYINPNMLDDISVAFEANEYIAQMLKNGEWKSVKNAYSKACGSCHNAGKDKLWLIDLDDDAVDKEEEIREYLKGVQPNIGEDKVALVVPTRHGKHLLVHPHDPRGFQMRFPNIDVHKDNPTVLYFPDSIEKKGE